MMNSVIRAKRTRIPGDETPHGINHPTFAEPDAEASYGPTTDPEEVPADFMADELTRDTARRMHYAAQRWQAARDTSIARRWRSRYYQLRDRIVLGNRKLVYRAVRRWGSLAHRSDDLIGECYIVLIRAVRVYNPWLGVRFSTYAYTCIMRALSRQAQRWSGADLAQCVPLDLLGDAGPGEALPDEPGEQAQRVGDFFRDDHPLLSQREKTILMRRFELGGDGGHTLEQVGRDLGLSKERVRQVQQSALGKLREALASTTGRALAE